MYWLDDLVFNYEHDGSFSCPWLSIRKDVMSQVVYATLSDVEVSVGYIILRLLLDRRNFSRRNETVSCGILVKLQRPKHAIIGKKLYGIENSEHMS